MSLCKLLASVLDSLTWLNTCPFTLPCGQLTCKALYYGWWILILAVMYVLEGSCVCEIGWTQCKPCIFKAACHFSLVNIVCRHCSTYKAHHQLESGHTSLEMYTHPPIHIVICSIATYQNRNVWNRVMWLTLTWQHSSAARYYFNYCWTILNWGTLNCLWLPWYTHYKCTLVHSQFTSVSSSDLLSAWFCSEL